MASTAKSGTPSISSNVKMRIQKWVGRAAAVGKQRPERDQRTQFEPSAYDTTSYGSRSEIPNSTKSSLPIPVSKSGKNYSSRGNNTSVSYPASLLHLKEEETAYYERDIPSSMNHGTRVYSSTGSLTSTDRLDRQVEITSKRRTNQWGRFLGKDGSNKKQKARSTDDLSSSEQQTDTKYHNEGIHNKRAVFKANQLKRSRQTSIDSIETLSSDSSDRQTTSFATSLEEPDEEEEFSTGNVEKLSEQINARLQKWVYLAEEKRDRRHSEESSGSSSDCTDGSPSTQAKEIRELESALKELVGNATSNARTRRLSRCDLLDGANSANSSGQRSRKTSRQDSYTAPDLTLLGQDNTSAGPDETEAECLRTNEAEKRPQSINALTGKREGGDGEASSAIRDQDRNGEVTKASYRQHARHEKVCSSDSGLSLEMDISAEKKQNYIGKNYLSPQTSNSSNGGNTSGLRDVDVICKDSPDIATSDKNSDPCNGNLEMTRNPQEVETCQPSDLSDDKRSKETNELIRSPSGASKVRFEIGGESYPRTRTESSVQSSTTGEAQSILENANNCLPPVEGRKIETPRRPCIMKRRSVPDAVYSLKMRADVRESMRQFLNFNDVGLSEFAVKCVRHANKKKQRVRKMNSAGIEESCSGSDDNANDKTAAASGEPGELNNPSQSPLSKEPAIKLGHREFAKTAEEAEIILATSGTRSAGNALPTFQVDGPRPQRLYKFPSLPMFYRPDETNEDAEKRQPMRSGRALSLFTDNADLKKCRSTTNLHEGDINASASKTRHSITSSNLEDPFFHGDASQTDKSDKAGKQKRYNILKPKSWLSKLKDENGNVQKGEKKLPLKTKSREQMNVSMEALI